jgi:hypothetical protein
MDHEHVRELSLLRAPTRLLDALARDLDAQIHASGILRRQVEQKLGAPEAKLQYDAIGAEAPAEPALTQRLGFDDRFERFRAGSQRIFRRFRDR